MHFKISSEKLRDTLSKLQSVIEKKALTPILDSILIEAESDSVTLISTNLENYLKCKISTEVISPGKACLPGKKFVDIVKVLDGEIEITSTDSYVKFACGKTIFKLATIDSTDFPKWPVVNPTQKIILNASEIDLLLTGVETTQHAIGEQDIRYVINSILLHLQPPDIVHFVTTDGHRLAHFKAQLENASVVKEEKLILPQKVATLLPRVIQNTQSVTLLIGDSYVAFDSDEFSFVSRLLEGQYPDYQSLLSSIKCDKVAIVDKEQFITSVKRVSTITKEISKAVRLSWNNNFVTISAVNEQLGEAQDELIVEYQHEPFLIGFNAEFLVDAIRNIATNKVKIAMGAPNEAVYITQDENASTRFLFEAIVMPLILV